MSEKQLELAYGFVQHSLGNFVIKGSLAKQQDFSDLPEMNLPAIGAVDNARTNRRDYYLMFHDIQQDSMGLINTNPGPMTSNMIGGLEDFFTERTFIGLHLGSTSLDNDSINVGYISEQISVNKPVVQVSEEEIERFLADQDYSWIYSVFSHLGDYYFHVVPAIVSLFDPYPSFEVPVLVARTIEMCVSRGYTESQIESTVQNMYRSSQMTNRPLGHVLENSGTVITMITSRTYDADVAPMLRTKDLDSKKSFVLTVTQPMSLTSKTLKQFSINADGLRAKTISGIRIGSPIYLVEPELIEKMMVPERSTPPAVTFPVAYVKGTEVPYRLSFIPDASLNGIELGTTGKGKSVFTKIMLCQMLRYNVAVDDLQAARNKAGFLLFDRQREYSSVFEQLEEIQPATSKYVEILNPLEMKNARVPLEEIPLDLLLQKEENPISTTIDMIKAIHNMKIEDSNGNKVEKYKIKYHKSNQKLKNRRLNPEMLNAIHTEYDADWKAIKGGYTKGQVDAAMRRLRRLSDPVVANIFGMEYDPNLRQWKYDVTVGKNNLLTKFWYAQRAGKSVVVSFGKNHSKAVSKAIRVVKQLLLKILDDDRQKMRTDADTYEEFVQETPLYFVINEEATDDMAHKGTEEVSEWISATTGSRKNLYGSIFIMQTTMGVSKTLLTQLDAMVAVFQISTNADRKEIRDKVAIDHIDSFNETIADADVGEAIIGINALRNRPFLIKGLDLQEYFTELDKDFDFFDPGVYLDPEFNDV